MKVNPEISITQAKNAIRPTTYWTIRRLRRQLYFIKQEIIKEWKESILGKYIFD